MKLSLSFCHASLLCMVLKELEDMLRKDLVGSPHNPALHSQLLHLHCRAGGTMSSQLLSWCG